MLQLRVSTPQLKILHAETKPRRSQINNKINKKLSYFIFTIYLFLTMPWGMRDLSFWNQDQTHIPCCVSAESQPLDRQGNPLGTDF